MKLAEEDVLRLESASNYLREALEISLRYGITIYDSLFTAQARSLNVNSLQVIKNGLSSLKISE